jgi:hypothetical protein
MAEVTAASAFSYPMRADPSEAKLLGSHAQLT